MAASNPNPNAADSPPAAACNPPVKIPKNLRENRKNRNLFVPQLINCNCLRIGQREFIIIPIDILHVEMANQAAVSAFCSIRKRLSSLNVQTFRLFWQV